MSEPQFSPCEEAVHIVNGPRAEAYGSAAKSLSTIAQMWGPILGIEVTNDQVALCMIQLKIARQLNKHQNDNLVDICGYVEIMARAHQEVRRV